MNTWERFDKTSFPNKEDFYSSLNMERITDADYEHVKKVFKIFNNKSHSSDIHFQDFIEIYKKYTSESYSFIVNDATLPSDNPLRFRKNLSK